MQRDVCMAALVMCASLGLAAMVGAAGDAERGRDVYEKSCVACHGPEGRGDGPTGREITPPAANFTSAGSQAKSVAELRATIAQGREGTAMIGWSGTLSERQIDDVLAYVLVLRKPAE